MLFCGILSMVSSQSVQPELWPLTPGPWHPPGHFPPSNGPFLLCESSSVQLEDAEKIQVKQQFLWLSLSCSLICTKNQDYWDDAVNIIQPLTADASSSSSTIFFDFHEINLKYCNCCFSFTCFSALATCANCLLLDYLIIHDIITSLSQ